MKKLLLTLAAVLSLTTANAQTWQLVTDAADLAAGDRLIIVNQSASVAMSTTTKSNNVSQTSVTLSDDKNTATITESVMTLSLGGETGAWTFTTENATGEYTNGYLYAASSNNNHLKVTSELNDNCKATITISNNIATIKFIGKNTRNWLRYNSGSSIFSCYGSGQKDVYLYKYVEASGLQPAGISFETNSFSITQGDTFTAPTLTNPNNLVVTYSSSNKTVATVDATTGAVTIVGAGSATITAETAGTETFDPGKASYTINVKGIVANIAEFIALIETGNDATATINGTVVVVYQRYNRLYIKDETGYLQVYGSGLPTYNVGDVIPAGITGKATTYNGVNQIGNPEVATFLASTGTQTVEPVKYEYSAIDASLINHYVVIEGVNIAGTTMTVGETTVNYSNSFDIEITEGSDLVVEAIVAFEGGKVCLYPVAITTASGQEICATPTFSIAGGSVSAGTLVEILCETAGATIEYSINGGDVIEYTEAIAIEEDCTIEAIAYKEGMEVSGVATAEFKIVDGTMFDFTQIYANETSNVTLTDITHEKSGITVTFSTPGSAPIYHAKDDEVRFYDKNTLTISAPEGYHIKMVSFEFCTGYEGRSISVNHGTYTVETGVWNAETPAKEENLILTNAHGAQIRFKTLLVEVEPNDLTGITDIELNNNAAVEYYNLQGVRVAEPTSGLYIRRQGNSATKVLVK